MTYQTIQLIGEGIAAAHTISPEIVRDDLQEMYFRDPDGETILRAIVRDDLPGKDVVQDALWRIAFS